MTVYIGPIGPAFFCLVQLLVGKAQRCGNKKRVIESEGFVLSGDSGLAGKGCNTRNDQRRNRARGVLEANQRFFVKPIFRAAP